MVGTIVVPSSTSWRTTPLHRLQSVATWTVKSRRVTTTYPQQNARLLSRMAAQTCLVYNNRKRNYLRQITHKL